MCGTGTGGTGLKTRTSGRVRGGGTGRTGLLRCTGDLERRAGCLFSPCKCGALAQDALGYADAPETQCAEPAQDILVQGGVLETRSAEPAPSILAGCPF